MGCYEKMKKNLTIDNRKNSTWIHTHIHRNVLVHSYVYKYVYTYNG
jgi:hypothetical protein